MKRGRYNIEINGVIKKFNVYQNDYSVYFIWYKYKYRVIEIKQRYKGGWLWELLEEVGDEK